MWGTDLTKTLDLPWGEIPRSTKTLDEPIAGENAMPPRKMRAIGFGTSEGKSEAQARCLEFRQCSAQPGSITYRQEPSPSGVTAGPQFQRDRFPEV
jgi:hypothetical protein